MSFELTKKDIGDIKQKTYGGKLLINLNDSAGHVDFSSQVTAALRVTDRRFVIADYVSDVSARIETVLR
ncbi:hypothetical protein K493DRAFT_382566 [Basidiobolus meristosporus CBS 931.73]|uniref:Tr-type G domain-containing protein n=1 Tax=Basidiobolus meristosporus CBS 931.73 TaxID=1314790 RepID=A0A1Y1XUY8_9FUNG|nr:hypothetical protein K493DRAFT_382566 [Basidiobolus meristosporus CBS 931.73]|eukprot:ORX89533.1 hypothetical protein K493DRAFT_382566 [Basidiobolus meristosporus CBS 931.73]